MTEEPRDEALRRLRTDMERVRAELHRALDNAGGDHLDAAVQKLSRDFDALLAAYLRLSIKKEERLPSSPACCPRKPR